MPEPASSRQVFFGLLRAIGIIALLLTIYYLNAAYRVPYAYAIVLIFSILSLESKLPRLEDWIARLGASAALLLFPLFYPPQYFFLTYLLFASLVIYGIAQKLRYGGMEYQRFVEKWEQTREKGFWLYFIKESAWFTFLFILIVISGQFLFYGHAPAETISASFAHSSVLLILFLIIFGLSCFVATITWFQKENRYERM